MGSDVLTVDVGYDRFTFDLILAKCKASGVTVWPLQMDENGLAPGFIAMVPHKILVRPGDLPRLKAIIEDVQPGPSGDDAQAVSGLRRFLYKLIGSIRL
jgi:hypothetical protein